MKTEISSGSTLFLLAALAATTIFAACTSTRTSPAAERKMAGATKPAEMPVADEEIEARLDSLAAASDGDYVHLRIGPCFGFCDGYVSISRESPAKFYIYDAEGWTFNETLREPIFYRLRRPIDLTKAMDLFDAASAAGIGMLENDTTMAITDQSYIWLRARVGGRTVVLDRVYLGGRKYLTSEEGGANLAEVYRRVRAVLLGPLFEG